mmetsp:Transcript_60736/g.96147  ORF Transcript_60736/g.96147 Transcript_60736/m.96147 type:complete len:223 (-) Transcript_60736:144-812(-)
MLLTLLEQRCCNTLLRRLPGVFAFQRLCRIQGEEAAIRTGAGHLLPACRIAQPQPWHGTSRHQAIQLRQSHGALSFQGLGGLLRLFQGCLLFCLLQSATLAAARSRGALLGSGGQTFAGPTKKEGGHLGSVTQGGPSSVRLVLALGSATALAQLLCVRSQALGCICEEVDHSGLQSFIKSLPALQDGKEERKGLLFGQVLPLAGQESPNDSIQSFVHLLLTP